MPSGIRLCAEGISPVAVSIRVLFLDTFAVATGFAVAPTRFYPATVAVFEVPEVFYIAVWPSAVRRMPDGMG